MYYEGTDKTASVTLIAAQDDICGENQIQLLHEQLTEILSVCQSIYNEALFMMTSV